MKNCLILFLLVSFVPQVLIAQEKKDSVVRIGNKYVTLSEVIVRSDMNVPGFIDRVKEDTTFYKAFMNLRVLNFSSLNAIQMFGRKGEIRATYNSRTRQEAWQGCRLTHKLEEKATGDFYNSRGGYNYYTAALYASLFFAYDTVCGESNIVKGVVHSLEGKSGMEKHKEQLKMLFFNPGMRIPGVPLMGNKVAIFDPENEKLYDFFIDMEEKLGRNCFVFRIQAKTGPNGEKNSQVVIDNMTTWFDYQSMEVVARTYQLSYSAGVYRFDVEMDVETTHYKDYLVPSLIRYNGEWSIWFKKKEKGVFTATLFDFGSTD